MRTLSYSMGVSLDGYINDPSGSIDWGGPDPELHAFHNERVGRTGVHLLGRRLYETMLYWETVDPSTPGVEGEFAALWLPLEKIVFSTTLDAVEGNARLATGGVVEEVERLKAQEGEEIAVGGAGLAATCAEHGLIDDFELFVYPIVLGGGTPYFPPLEQRIELELVETRIFAGGVTYLHHRRAR